jgi:putative flippase GtrA
MRLVRYFFVGGAAALLDISLFTLFAHVLGFNYLVVASCTFILATIANYVLSIRHVFESGSRYRKTHEIVLVFLVSVVGLLCNQSVLYFMVNTLNLHLVLAKIVATATVFAWNYLLRAKVIFYRVEPAVVARTPTEGAS